MIDLIDAAIRWRAEGERVALATVIGVDGSAPRGEGAKMLISGSGKIVGSVSGGCVEGAVAAEAAGVLASGEPRIVRYGINRNMMWDVGLACGGTIEVFIQPLAGEAAVEDLDVGSVRCTIVRGPARVGERFVAGPSAGDGWSVEGSLGDIALDTELVAVAAQAAQSGSARTHAIGAFEVFVDPRIADSRLLIVGAVHIAVALCDYAAKCGFSVTIVDPRERLNNAERFPAASRLAVGWPEDELPALRMDENTFVAVLTHDEKFDDPTLDYVLSRRVRYVGAIGSKKTHVLRRTRLIDAGVPASSIERLHAPIGLDIGSQTPEEIAIAILAEMIAAKYGRRGTPLREREEPRIHA